MGIVEDKYEEALSGIYESFDYMNDCNNFVSNLDKLTQITYLII